MRKCFLISILLLLTIGLNFSYGQPSLETFGRNRVQTKKLDWSFYQLEHFRVYYYGRSGKTLGRYVAEQAERDVANIERNSGGLFPNEINILVYNSYDDYLQTNIGLNSNLQMEYNNPAGNIHLVGNKLLLYFNGSHIELRRQLREGMSQIVMEHLAFGANFKQMARNAVLMDMPRWITEGYTAFLVDGWTATDDNDWKNIVTQDKKLYFNDLTEEFPQLAGKAFWKYIRTKYGENRVSDLLYLTQIKGSINQATQSGLNQKIHITFDSLMVFYKDLYQKQHGLFDNLDTATALIRIPIPKDGTRIRNILTSPRGRDVAYTTWKHGQYQVLIQKAHQVKGETRIETASILFGGLKDFEGFDDPDYPLIAWDNTGFRLGMIYRKGHSLHLKIYNSTQGKISDYIIPERRIDRITGFTFLQDDEEIAFSGIKDGQSDIYTAHFKRGFRVQKITDDPWDDYAPIYVAGGSRNGLVFLSNRPEAKINILPLPNELPSGQLNAFFYSLTTKSYELLRLTNETRGTISNVVPYGQDNFAYLSDKNGVNNRYVVLFARDKNNIDSAFSIPVTNFSRSIKYQNYNPASGKIADALQYKDAIYVYFNPIEIPKVTPEQDLAHPTLLPRVSFVDIPNHGQYTPTPSEPPTPHKPRQQSPNNQNIFQEEAPVNQQIRQPAQQGKINLDQKDVFQSDFPTEQEHQPVTPRNQQNQSPSQNHQSQNLAEQPAAWIQSSSSEKSQLFPTHTKDGKRILYVDSTYLKLRSNKYYQSFGIDFFSVRMDDNLMFNRYQSYDQNAGQYQNPSLGGMLMVRLYDRMEDYRFTGGLRLPFSGSGLGYYVQFENYRRRFDWAITAYRQADRKDYNFLVGSGGQGFIITEQGKTITNILQGKVAYPFNNLTKIQLFTGVRQDRMIIRAQDVIGEQLPNVQDVWGMSRLEYVFDNTKNPTTNIWNGFRYKFFAETMYKVFSDNDVYQTNVDTSGFKKHSWVYNLGFDFRYYEKIYKNIIFASRLSGAHSGGSQKIAYFLGGVANDMHSSFDQQMSPSGRNDYGFQALASDLRGYKQNARNGNTYLLGNFEVRMPILTSFIHRPIQSVILKNLQVVGFIDVGNAWEGWLPTEENSNRPTHFDWPPNTEPPTVTINVPNANDYGIAMGYGLGLRTMLWGYFVRWDNALNKDGKYRWSISFGTDF